jgi:hypothetical protein
MSIYVWVMLEPPQWPKCEDHDTQILIICCLSISLWRLVMCHISFALDGEVNISKQKDAESKTKCSVVNLIVPIGNGLLVGLQVCLIPFKRATKRDPKGGLTDLHPSFQDFHTTSSDHWLPGSDDARDSPSHSENCLCPRYPPGAGDKQEVLLFTLP